MIQRKWFLSSVFVTGLSLVLLGGFSSCSRKTGLDRAVGAATPEELDASRERLVNETDAEWVQYFDTAIQELKLSAMNEGMAGAPERERAMRLLVNGKPARTVILLGWKAREARLKRELAEMTGKLAHDGQLSARSGATDSVRYVSNLIQNEQDIVAQLTKRLADTEQRIAGWEPTAKN